MTASVLVGSSSVSRAAISEKTFDQDCAFLAEHVETIVLSNADDEGAGPRVVVVPAYQARVMTSTAGGVQGGSFGWINYPHIESGETAPQINVYGGEDRFWLGPEGGQFGLFFPAGAEFTFANWKTPAVIDTEPFAVVERDRSRLVCRREATIENYSGTKFQLRIERTVELLDRADAAASIGVELSATPFVGYRTTNRVTNRGDSPWTVGGGLPSIWILGMYKHGPKTTVVIPYRGGDDVELGPVVNDDYFGRISSDRLKVAPGAIFFAADGRSRGKIGLSPQRSRGVCGSFDADRNVLTVVKYNQPEPGVRDYVNSKWARQDAPFAGDAINAYNDGPPEPGVKPLGPFYELETSSPALKLAPNAAGEHIQETYHFQGDRQRLDAIARRVFGMGLEAIDAALPDNDGE